MKKVYLIRHAKAIARDSGITDSERYLTKSGKSESVVMAKKLKEKEVMPEILLSSPAIRAVETARIFAKILEYPLKDIQYINLLYNSQARTLVDVIKKTNNSYNSLMLFGHEPSLSQCAAYLLKEFKEELAKSGVICIHFKNDNWRSISEGQGSLKFFEVPVDKVKKSEKWKIVKSNIINKLNENINISLKEIDSEVAKDLGGYVEKISQKIARHFIKILKISNSRKS